MPYVELENMRYGFVIDHRKCIGCHACTVACKSENEVPLGTFRTWVKYIEKGEYPDTRRFFSVMRCNHCDDAPCITICPVTALFRRPDGIVDFNGDRCIGCKSCMQACPYDALYINPNTNTAEKCNYCAHRVEARLEPACVIVCPVEAIISGDMDDPASKIHRLIASEQTQVRKPEAGTRPKLHYIEADQAALRPTEQTHTGGYLWSEIQMDPAMMNEQALAEAEARAKTTYDVSHERPWGWKVSAYLWTKSISAGAFLLAAIAIVFGLVRNSWLFETAAPQVAAVFLVATLALLVLDLKRPERFLRILLTPQWKSWLVIGGYILLIYGALIAAWMAVDNFGWYALEAPVMILGAVFAAMSAIYSAFLFRQARGRVFWHSTLTPLHLLAQAMVAGACVLMIVLVIESFISGTEPAGPAWEFLYYELIGALVANGVLIGGELFMPEENVEKVRAARLITKGYFSKMFWGGVVILGVIVPVIALSSGAAQNNIIAAIVSLLALGGLFLWEHVWVQAGQAVPLS
ncbi:MAG TPA: NrfD/PsrC family molybdoenzyme membrane anchor subunit [Blastocatellia bacterium]|nr:NrfD/PsrC family molybdoenzyme membrane anchor subunit [Blastocatellia bacterium]